MKVKFINYATIAGVIFIIIQQAIVASSTALIAQLSHSIMHGEGYLLWLGLFVVSLTVVYIPTTLTNYFINKAKYITFGSYITDFGRQAYNRPNLYYNSNFRAEKEPYFTHEAWLIIQEDYFFIVDVLSIFFNVAFNVLVLSIFLDWAFFASYIVAIPLSLICILISKSRLEKKSDKMQQSRNGMMQIINHGWDTILLGNKWNMSLWKNRFIRSSQTAGTDQRKLTLEIDIMSLATLVLSALPIIIVLFMSFVRAYGNTPMLAMLVATAPRQILTIQYLSDMIGLFVQLNDKVRRTKQLSANIAFSEVSDTNGKITWGRVYIQDIERKVALQNLNDLYLFTNNFAKGRYIVTGENGAGKTTLLAEIKLQFGDSAYFLPSNSKMMFQNDEQSREFSTGEKTLANLDEISKNICSEGISVLLLDEWDANLDKENILYVNSAVGKLSNSICVIEVTHKK